LLRRLVPVLAAALAVGSGCGGGDDPATTGAPASRPLSDRLVDFSLKPPYVNALDVDPADGSYLLTTNRGFWRIDPETDEVTQVTGNISAGNRSSTVGTFLEILVTGPGQLLGSGHPDSKRELPPYLGMIESGDGGKTWSVISRLGDADLHKIVVKHDRIYAFDAILGAILVSEDGGRTFTEHFTPPSELVIDFDVDPEDPDHIVASTEQRLLRSQDGGDSWRPSEQAEGIRLVWTAPGALFRADRDGTVRRSSDGVRWEEVGRVPGEPYKFKALADEELLLALSDGTVLRTADGGRTWEEEFRP
jgi:hypothetical protein